MVLKQRCKSCWHTQCFLQRNFRWACRVCVACKITTWTEWAMQTSGGKKTRKFASPFTIKLDCFFFSYILQLSRRRKSILDGLSLNIFRTVGGVFSAANTVKKYLLLWSYCNEWCNEWAIITHSNTFWELIIQKIILKDTYQNWLWLGMFRQTLLNIELLKNYNKVIHISTFKWSFVAFEMLTVINIIRQYTNRIMKENHFGDFHLFQKQQSPSKTHWCSSQCLKVHSGRGATPPRVDFTHTVARLLWKHKTQRFHMQSCDDWLWLFWHSSRCHAWQHSPRHCVQEGWN